MQYNIICLQDTHFTEENEHMIRNEWGYQCLFNSYKSNSRGVAIFFKNNFEFKIFKERKEPNGNFIAVEIGVENLKITLINLYSPNEDNPFFYNLVSETIDDLTIKML